MTAGEPHSVRYATS